MSILVATDFSDSSRAALQMAVSEAHKRSTSLTLIHCVDTMTERWDLLEETEAEEEDRIPKAARKHLEAFFNDTVPREQQPNVEAFEVVEDHAAVGIRQVEKKGDFELIVVGATGGSALTQFFLGSTAEEVVRSSDTPVLVVPEGDYASTDRILAPVDLSACSRASLLAAVQLARREDATLDIIHITNLPTGAMLIMEQDATETDRRRHEKLRWEQLEEFVEGIDLGGIDYEVDLRFGDPARQLTQFAEDNDIDRIVMGTHGRRGFDRFFLGSTAAKVLRRMPCPVMTIRHRKEAD